jgi:acylphosphatase
MSSVAKKFLITGEVQGVGYRFFAQRAAARHQVRGHVRNCADGSVEVVAEGSQSAVEEFKKDLVTGPQCRVCSKWKRLMLSRRDSSQVLELNAERNLNLENYPWMN